MNPPSDNPPKPSEMLNMPQDVERGNLPHFFKGLARRSLKRKRSESQEPAGPPAKRLKLDMGEI